MNVVNVRIKNKRLSLNLTLADVAEYLGVKEATAQRYESGEIKNIKHETIVKLANLFKCRPAYLMGWENEPEVTYEFSERIKELRLKKNLTQTELSKLLSVSKSTISMYENGNREPDLKTLKAIADFFNVSIDYLLIKSNNDIKTIASNTGTEDWTKEELAEIESFKEFVKSKRKK
ncbi:helix-turn-helix transcriptional regulator [Vallitaleaceae bacterium 9-2]